MKIQYADSWVHFILFYGRSNIGMSRNVEYGVQRELNLDMGTNYCTQEGHLLGEQGEESYSFWYCALLLSYLPSCFRSNACSFA
jgi:hypothetical protein